MNRYEVRFANGYWRTFDTFLYTTVWLHSLKTEAEDATAKKNEALKR